MLWVTMMTVYFSRQLVDQLLDLGGGDRIERRARLVHQHDVGLHGKGARLKHSALLLYLPTARRPSGNGQHVLSPRPTAPLVERALDSAAGRRWGLTPATRQVNTASTLSRIDHMLGIRGSAF